jgi:adenosylcobinamide-GDP ribazoletransferase
VTENSTVDEPLNPRDEWMRRTGPLYPFMVALQVLTKLPVLRGVEPTSEDRQRAVIWFPVVGGLLGGTLALVAWILLETSLVPAVAAAFALGGAVAVRGAVHEIAITRYADQLSRDRDDYDTSLGLAGIIALLTALALRGVAFLGIDTDDWIGALVVSQLVAAWAVLLLIKLGAPPDESAYAPPEGLAIGGFSWSLLGIASGIGLVVAVLFGRWTGVLALMLTGLVVFVVGMFFQRREEEIGHVQLAVAAGVCELVVLLTFAIAHPADISPWVSP